jgi:murein DD-endopeptidase MepM/ murein hydrolase activator NlpD
MAAAIGGIGYFAPQLLRLPIERVRNRQHNLRVQNDTLVALLDTMQGKVSRARHSVVQLQTHKHTIEDIEMALSEHDTDTAVLDTFLMGLSPSAAAEVAVKHFRFAYTLTLNCLKDPELFTTLPVAYPCPASKTISRAFGRYKDPFTRKHKGHFGVDFVADEGTPVQVTAHGWVARVRKSARWGIRIVVAHRYEVETVYAHLRTTYVHRGQYVRKGDTIGEVGTSGLTIGPHLHYEIHSNGRAIDPEKLLFPLSADVRTDTLISFTRM